jgi:L-seryl-tRNA(Ser) seleniumtransferase
MLGITGEEVLNILWNSDPRIALGGGGPGARPANETGISITAYMMTQDDVKIVADRLYEVLSAKRPAWKPEILKPPAGDLTGRWDVHIEFTAGNSDHVLFVTQHGNELVGTHQGDFVARDFSGVISADDVRIASSVGEVHGAALSYRFTGKLNGDTMSGALDMGEYLGASWTAKRHTFNQTHASGGAV